MSPSMRFTGLPVSEGMAAGRLHIAEMDPAASATPDEVAGAFAAVAAARSALAGRLRQRRRRGGPAGRGGAGRGDRGPARP